MTRHYFKNDFVNLHYYKFGSGAHHMLCFHGFGMHGKQFYLAKELLGNKYTFWGFDLFFHQHTRLEDQGMERVKQGLKKSELAELIHAFCIEHHIERFSVLGYSMGSHYATTIVEELPGMINEYIVAAPSSINPGILTRFFSKNRFGNRLLEKLMMSETAMINLIKTFKHLRLIDASGTAILQREVGTPEYRFALYACFTYLRLLETDEDRLIHALNHYNIKSIFIFGKHDKMYLPRIGQSFFAKYGAGKVVLLEENHEMINENFVKELAASLL